MKLFFISTFVLATINVFGIKLPEGVTMDSLECSFAKGKFSYNFLRNNEAIGSITPGTCHFDNLDEGKPDNQYYADFYMNYSKETFSTKQDAMNWLETAFANYYKPVVVTKWQNLKVQPPKVTLKYPWDWTYRLDKYPGIFKTSIQSENKLTLLLKDQRGSSEILMLIRTPNTARLTVAQVMETTAGLNRAIDLKNNKITDFIIDGKTFKSCQNTFMTQMNQWHFWFADEQEIIYLNYNLLKDEKLFYPEVMNQIVQSIKW